MDGGSIAFDQSTRSLKIDSPIPPADIVVTSFAGTDAISAPFAYAVEVVTTASPAAMRALLGQPVTVWLRNLDPADRRPINARVRRIAGPTPMIRGQTIWQADLVPMLSFLDYSADIRIFQSLAIPDILRKVFGEHGLTDVELRNLMGTYPALDYCVQYRETAFRFVSRLMEHVGLFYWHEHREGGHKLVIADHNAMATAALSAPAQTRTHSQTPDIGDVVQDMEFRPGKWTMTDYDFEAPSKNLQTQAPTVIAAPPMTSYEIYEYPGQYTDTANGAALTRARIEHEEAQFSRIEGPGFRALFDPGKTLEIAPAGSAPPGPQDKFLLVQVQHTATDPPPASNAVATASYENRFTAIPFDRIFRPARTTPKPFVRGLQTAVVTGPAGETIYTDKHGRVKVQFFWDRNPDGLAPENSSCWLRVSQVWADNAWGAIHIPRLGEEVIVDFLEGDPDRPIITGRVYNGTNKVPYPLPANKTQSGIKSRSVPGPGSNELRFEDKAGSEEVYLHAQNDLTIMVEHDENDTIENDRSVKVKVNDTRTVGGNLSDTVTGNDTREVDGNFKETIAGSVTQTIGGSVSETTTGSVTEMVTGAVTQTYASTLMQTVTGGITIATPATMTVTATGGYNLIAPTSAWQTGPQSLSAYGFVFAAIGQNVQVAGNNSQVFGAQQQVVGINVALNGMTSTINGVQQDVNGISLKEFGSKIENAAAEIVTAAIMMLL